MCLMQWFKPCTKRIEQRDGSVIGTVSLSDRHILILAHGYNRLPAWAIQKVQEAERFRV